MQSQKHSGIYRLEFVSGHFYIGQSANVKKRWRIHRTTFRNGSMARHHPKLYNIWLKYGEPVWEPLVYCELKEMDRIEQHLITYNWGNPLFANTSPSATSSRGIKRTHVAWQKGKKFTEIHCQRLSDAKKGRVGGIRNSNHKLTEDQVRAIRARYKHQVKGDGSTAIAKDYGISYRTVLYIVNGKRYADVI